MWSSAKNDRATVEWLLSPISVREFFEKYFERAPLHISRDDLDFYKAYFSLAEVERVLYGSELRSADLQVVKDGTPARVEAYVRQKRGPKLPNEPPSEIIHPDRVSALFASGCTLILDKVHKYSLPLAALCQEMETCFRFQANPNMYLTPAGSQGFDTHYDTHDTLIIQIEGTKRWRVYGAAVDLPLQHQNFNKKLHKKRDVEFEIEMRPGDLLYVPRGFLHDATANDALSLHITIGLFPPLWIDVFNSALTNAAETDLLLRKAANDSSAETLSAFAEQVFSPERLTEALQRLRQSFVTQRDNGLHGQLTQLARLSDLSETSMVQKRPNVLYELTVDDERTKLLFSGKTLGFDKDDAAVVRALQDDAPVSVAALLTETPNALKVVRKLIKEGFAVQIDTRASVSDRATGNKVRRLPPATGPRRRVKNAIRAS